MSIASTFSIWSIPPISLDLIRYLILSALVAFSLAFFIVTLIVRKYSNPQPVIIRFESENYFFDRQSGKRKTFPIANYYRENEIDKVYLSVVIPAYNEEKRLPVMLDEALDYLENRSKKGTTVDASESLARGLLFTYEIIVVDDGSSDKTSQVVLDYCDKYGTSKIRLLKLEANRGKGGAVRLGVLSARGRFILFADADGATKFSDIEKLELVLTGQRDESKSNVTNNIIAIGSRAHLEQEAVATRSIFRTFLMHGFHFLVWFSAVRTVRDTQCGFKLFPRHLAMKLFSWTHIERWAFDVELLFLAEKVGIQVVEVSVNWTEVDGSKIVPVFSWLQMGRDVLTISYMYLVGAWNVPVYQINQ